MMGRHPGGGAPFAQDPEPVAILVLDSVAYFESNLTEAGAGPGVFAFPGPGPICEETFTRVVICFSKA